MDEKQKEKIALFRYGVISEFVGTIRLEYGELERLIKQQCERHWDIPFSHKTSISQSTIRRWIRLYENSGGDYKALFPESRSDQGKSRMVDGETVLSLIKLRKENPLLSVPQLIKEMENLCLLPPDFKLCRTTAYRILKREGLMIKNPIDKTDRRRYEAKYPNEIWQSDVMHGPSVMHKGKMRKAYLIAFIDDHSRLIPHGEFFSTERIEPFLNAFRQAVLKRGVPRKLYVDNGAAFRSNHLHRVCASLGISKYHAPPYTPQGKGKIERFFRTVRGQYLNCFKGETLEELNIGFDYWINNEYHKRVHSSTGESPFKRFAKHVEMIRRAPSDMEDHFRKEARRRVTKDRTISLNSKLYEAPAVLIGEYVSLLYHAHNPSIVEIHKGKSYGFLTPLDKNINSTVFRSTRKKQDDGDKPIKPKSGKLPF